MSDEPKGYCTHCNDACPRCSDVPFDAAERAAVVRFLRALAEDKGCTWEEREMVRDAADAIERGEHLSSAAPAGPESSAEPAAPPPRK